MTTSQTPGAGVAGIDVDGATGPSGFVPPPYPYDRLSQLAAEAATKWGTVVDLSIGTPCDPTSPAVIEALSTSGSENGYPSSVGSAAFRQSAARYLERRFGVSVDTSAIAACVGTKELVASTAWYLRLRNPSADTVLGPALAYPTYEMGAVLGGCRYVAVPHLPDGGPDLDGVDPADAARAVVLWLNSPANPSGAVFDLSGASSWGRRHGVPVCSDECYAEFTWDGPAQTILSGGPQGVVAVHSLSKRSNFAGARVGFYGGDPDLVSYLSEVRKHAGLMVPGPVQRAAEVALDDDAHVEDQRRRYHRRLVSLAEALRRCGLEASVPAGSFYLWVPVPSWAAEAGRASGSGGDWALTEALARQAGMLVSPGSFYGEAGAAHVRIAVVQPDERLAELSGRLAGLGALGP